MCVPAPGEYPKATPDYPKASPVCIICHKMHRRFAQGGSKCGPKTSPVGGLKSPVQKGIAGSYVYFGYIRACSPPNNPTAGKVKREGVSRGASLGVFGG